MRKNRSPMIVLLLIILHHDNYAVIWFLRIVKTESAVEMQPENFNFDERFSGPQQPLQCYRIIMQLAFGGVELILH